MREFNHDRLLIRSNYQALRDAGYPAKEARKIRNWRQSAINNMLAIAKQLGKPAPIYSNAEIGDAGELQAKQYLSVYFDADAIKVIGGRNKGFDIAVSTNTGTHYFEVKTTINGNIGFRLSKAQVMMMRENPNHYHVIWINGGRVTELSDHDINNPKSFCTHNQKDGSLEVHYWYDCPDIEH